MTLAREASRRSADPRSHAETQSVRRGIDRRTALKAGAGLFLGPATLAACGTSRARPTEPRVAVVGAGIAGLVCAHELAKSGVRATIYDASARVGGRMRSIRGTFGEQVAEFGGELIDSGHETMHALAAELELELDDLAAFDAPVRKDTFFIGGRVLEDQEVVEKFTPIAAEMARAVVEAEADPSAFEATDQLSIRAWLDGLPDADRDIKTLLDVAYTIEYGLDADEQSVFNLLYLIDYDVPDPFRVFGDSDEAFHVKGGNDQIPSGLAARLEGQLLLGHRLARIAPGVGGSVRLAFVRGGTSLEEDFDQVVLALPFSTLREVENTLGFPSEKEDVIRNLGYGTNSKLIGGFSSRPWRTEGMTSGSATSDNGLQALWETSRGQPGEAGILTNFLGGRIGLEIGAAAAEGAFAAALPKIDAIFPGSADAYSGIAVLAHWASQPHARGSYTCYRPGQWAYFGLEKTPVGQVHFAGEHTSEDFQGYMEGGAESGARAALEVAEALGLATDGLLAGRASARRRRRARVRELAAEVRLRRWR